MRLTAGGRNSGKMIWLLRESALTGIPIMVSTGERAAWLKDRARDMGLHIPEPIVYKPALRPAEPIRIVIFDEKEKMRSEAD